MSDRKGLLIRVGIDQTFGSYNAPINPITNDYIYMPIPQSDDDFKSGMRTSYDDLLPYFKSWCHKNSSEIEFPQYLSNKATHLDPDFCFSTYGDQATGRGHRVGTLKKGDFLVFFASFKPISKCSQKLIYAIYGIMFVDNIVQVGALSKEKMHKNAHSRVCHSNNEHLIVFANPKRSGRFNRAIPIGEFRNGAYRVKKEILDEWGGIGVKDGFIQRSICPPWFTNPEKFIRWIKAQNVQLINNNW